MDNVMAKREKHQAVPAEMLSKEFLSPKNIGYMNLGESTPITTVQREEVVLTGADGQTFKMKVADLAEAVRKVMPVATLNKNGLMSRMQSSKVDGINALTAFSPEIVIKTDIRILGDVYNIFSIKQSDSTGNIYNATFFLTTLNSGTSVLFKKEGILYSEITAFIYNETWHFHFKFYSKYGTAYIFPLSNIGIFEIADFTSIPDSATHIKRIS